MKEMQIKFINNPNDAGLTVISTPTGSGKSTTVRSIVIDDITGRLTINRKIFYITPLKKNLEDSFSAEHIIKDIKEEFKSDLEKGEGFVEDFENNYLHLMSNEDAINTWFDKNIKLTKHKDNPMDCDYIKKYLLRKKPFQDSKTLCESLMNLVCFVARRKKLQQQNLDLDPETFIKYENAFRKSIRKALKQASGNDVKESRSLIMDNKEWEWVKDIYAGCMIYDKKYISMSVDKFLNKVDPIYDNSFYIYDEETFYGSVLYMDEFDACYDTFINKIINDGLRVDEQIDLIELFDTISSRLLYKEWSSDITRNERKEIEESLKRYKPELIKASDEIKKKYNLECSIKCEDDGNISYVLFNDDEHYFLQKNNKRKAVVCPDPENGKNRLIFLSADEEAPAGGYSMEALVSEISGFFKLVAQKFASLTKNLEKNKAHKKDYVETCQSMEASAHSLFNELLNTNSDDGSDPKIQFFDDLLRDNGNLFKKKDMIGKGARMSYYDRGIRYYTMINSEHNSLKTRINCFCFNRTPEKMLLAICRRFKVIGLSATGVIDAIGNFDLAFLKNRLKGLYIKPTKEDMERMRKSFDETQKGYDLVNIHTELIGSPDGEYDEEDWYKLLSQELPKDAPIDFISGIDPETAANEIINELDSSIPDENKDHIKARYYRIAVAYRNFITHSSVYSALCMLNILPKKNKSEMDTEKLGSIFKIISKTCNQEYDKDVFVVFTSKEFSKQKEEVTKELSKGKRRFVISSYNTIGSGQNLQYKIPEQLKNVIVNVNSRTSDEKDYDMIYLDKPTNLIVNTYGDSLEQPEVIRSFNESEKLYEKNEITNTDRHNAICRANSKSKLMSGSTERGYYKSPSIKDIDSVRKQCSKGIIQSVGRICRTPNKMKDIYIYADASICSVIDTSVMDDNVLNKETVCLLEEINKRKSSIQNPNDKRIQILINKADKNEKRTNMKIKRSLNIINGNPERRMSDEAIEEYENYRLAALRHPNIDENDGDDFDILNEMLVELPEQNDHLYYDKKDDYTKASIYLKDRPANCRKMCEEKTFLPYLMQYDFIRKYFEKNGYATKWEKKKYIMTPTLYTNIYKGILGEAAAVPIFEHFLHKSLLPITDNNLFEKFDFIIEGTNIWVDIKDMHTSTRISRDDYMQKVLEKKEICHADYVMILNVMNDKDEKYHECKLHNNGILIADALVPMNPEDVSKAWFNNNLETIEGVIRNGGYQD